VKTYLRFLLSLLGLSVGIFLLSFGIRIKKVSCFIGEKPKDKSVVCRQLKFLEGTSLLFRDLYTDQKVLESTIITETKEVFEIKEIVLSLNGEIIFYFEQSPPLYRVELEGKKLLFTYSGEGRQDDERVIVPELIDENGVFADDFEYNHNFLVVFLQTLDKESLFIQEIYFISNTKIRMLVQDFPDFIINSGQDPREQALRFKRIFRELKPNEIDVLLKEIDLRFELPVLKTTESSDSAEFLIDSHQ
jgi:hypothetical protein